MRRIAAVVFAVLLALPAAAQEPWPSRPITLISPYPPGGASDFLARTLAEAESRHHNNLPKAVRLKLAKQPFPHNFTSGSTLWNRVARPDWSPPYKTVT